MMKLSFLPSQELVFRFSCSMEQVREVLAGNILPLGARPCFNELPVGVLEGDRFSFHFVKNFRNSWRPEFRGIISAEKDQVVVTIVGGLSTATRIFSTIYIIALFIVMFTALIGYISGQAGWETLFSGALFSVLSVALPSWLYLTEFSHDRVRVQSLFSSLECINQ